MKKFTKIFILAFGIALAMLVVTGMAQEGTGSPDTTQVGITDDAGRYLGAALAVGIAGLGAALGMGTAGSAAIGAIVEDNSMFTTAIIFIVLIEAVAIYGLLVAILLIFAA